MSDTTPTCGIAGCTGSHYPQDHNELAALRAENQQLRDECLRLAPLWADYSEDVTVEGVAVVRCHPEDSDKVRDHVAALRLEIQKLAADVLSLEAELEEVRMFKQQRESDCETFGKVVDALKAERDELIGRCDGYWVALELECAERMAAEAERDRYRAALERIAEDSQHLVSTEWTYDVATNALNGGDDE